MYEYEIYNDTTKEYNIIFGYSIADAWKRTKQFDKTDWVVVRAEYID